MQITAAALVASTLGGALWVHQRADARSTPSYRLGKVEQGTIRSTVSATGSLSAVRTVEVGTQVSGQIAAVYVDYNSHVTKGQLIARIDPILQQQGVQDAQTGVARAEAPLTQTRLELERSKALHDEKIITDAEYNLAQSNYAVAKANAASAQISLDKARQNLAYTNIYSPIEGVVVERAMDVGQTVAASLASPRLFVIANDLSQMQILASVDESDIGKITPGQPVTFTVQSYPDRQFQGSVTQVRLNATTVNNVVSYTAIVSTPNADGRLLPGMTATVKFITGSADNVLSVPVAALRFTPSADATTDVSTPPSGGAGPDARSGRGPGAGLRAPGAGLRARTGKGTLWTVDAQGLMAKHVVTTGLSDGQRTQVQGDGIAAGSSIVIGSSQSGATATAPPTTNPLQASGGRGGRGGAPGGF
jgi:HlyD family secretion protein